MVEGPYQGTLESTEERITRRGVGRYTGSADLTLTLLFRGAVFTAVQLLLCSRSSNLAASRAASHHF